MWNSWLGKIYKGNASAESAFFGLTVFYCGSYLIYALIMFFSDPFELMLNGKQLFLAKRQTVLTTFILGCFAALVAYFMWQTLRFYAAVLSRRISGEQFTFLGWMMLIFLAVPFWTTLGTTAVTFFYVVLIFVLAPYVAMRGSSIVNCFWWILAAGTTLLGWVGAALAGGLILEQFYFEFTQYQAHIFNSLTKILDNKLLTDNLAAVTFASLVVGYFLYGYFLVRLDNTPFRGIFSRRYWVVVIPTLLLWVGGFFYANFQTRQLDDYFDDLRCQNGRELNFSAADEYFNQRGIDANFEPYWNAALRETEEKIEQNTTSILPALCIASQVILGWEKSSALEKFRVEFDRAEAIWAQTDAIFASKSALPYLPVQTSDMKGYSLIPGEDGAPSNGYWFYLRDVVLFRLHLNFALSQKAQALQRYDEIKKIVRHALGLQPVRGEYLSAFVQKWEEELMLMLQRDWFSKEELQEEINGINQWLELLDTARASGKYYNDVLLAESVRRLLNNQYLSCSKKISGTGYGLFRLEKVEPFMGIFVRRIMLLDRNQPDYWMGVLKNLPERKSLNYCAYLALLSEYYNDDEMNLLQVKLLAVQVILRAEQQRLASGVFPSEMSDMPKDPYYTNDPDDEYPTLCYSISDTIISGLQISFPKRHAHEAAEVPIRGEDQRFRAQAVQVWSVGANRVNDFNNRKNIKSDNCYSWKLEDDEGVQRVIRRKEQILQY